MKNAFLALTALSGFFSTTSNLQAENWAFRPSYFTHITSMADYDNPNLPQSRTPYRLPYKDMTPGVYVRGGYRFNSTVLRNGASTDRSYRTEGFIQFMK